MLTKKEQARYRSIIGRIGNLRQRTYHQWRPCPLEELEARRLYLLTQARVSAFLRNVALAQMAHAHHRGGFVNYTEATAALREEDICLNP